MKNKNRQRRRRISPEKDKGRTTKVAERGGGVVLIRLTVLNGNRISCLVLVSRETEVEEPGTCGLLKKGGGHSINY